MGAGADTDLGSAIAGLIGAIDHVAAATEIALAAATPADDDPERRELARQLGALRERVGQAVSRNDEPQALRAELATLLSFARTLQADAENWGATLAEQILDLERRRAVARREREAVAAEREKLARRRDALQLAILQTASRMAQQYRGECRRTIPVFTLGEGLTVCSVSVSCPRRGFRLAKHWLVTLTRSHDLLVRRE